INVCVGTDSLASNPSLSILEELRYLRRMFEDITARQLTEMGTLRAARALGMENTVGSLEPGKQADIVVVPLQATGPLDPLENLLRGELGPVQVYVAGQQT
ncbi:MAG: amidohydrolase family protein, partial [Phycisphaerae bacterium]|nr:amidohydrolase family protein [Phycisphaerae bacterium]